MEDLGCHCAMYVKNVGMRRDICSSIRQVHRSTRNSKGTRHDIAKDSDNCVHLKQTIALVQGRITFLQTLAV